MEDFIERELEPTETCIICTQHFDANHYPFALKCGHIFGHKCLEKWLRNGKGATNSCPCCRQVIFSTDEPSFDPVSIWATLCSQPSERIHSFLTAIWQRIQNILHGRLSGHFTTTEILTRILFPALRTTARDQDAFHACCDLIATTWVSLGRPDTAHGLAIPLVRLVRLMSQAASTLPKWLTSVPRMNALFWRANAALGLAEKALSWTHIAAAAGLHDTRLFPLLHLYTVLVSQGIAHTEQPRRWPERRDEVVGLVVERCCRRIGGEWRGSPERGFKERVGVVYMELRRWQLAKGCRSLRALEGEEDVVRGLWAVAGWGVASQARGERSGLARGVASIK